MFSNGIHGKVLPVFLNISEVSLFIKTFNTDYKKALIFFQHVKPEIHLKHKHPAFISENDMCYTEKCFIISHTATLRSCSFLHL